MNNKKEAALQYGITCLISLTIAALLVYFIGAREPWLDEFHTILLSRMPWSQLLEYVTGDVHPPLYFALAKLWTYSAGEAVLAPRYLSLALHLAAAAVFGALIRRRYPHALTWVVGTALFLSAPALFYYASEARGYSLAVLWSTAALAALLLCIDAGERTCASRDIGKDWKRFAVLGALLAMGFYIHYTNVFIAAGLIAALFLVQRSLIRSAIAAGVCAVVCAPWVPVTLGQIRAKTALDEAKRMALSDPQALSFASASPDGPSTVTVVRNQIENVASIAGVLPADSIVLMAALALPIVAAAIAAILGISSRKHGQPFAISAVVTITMLVGLLIMRMYERRYMLAIAPFVLLALMSGLDWLRTRWRGVSVMVAAAVLAIYFAGCIRIVTTPQPKSLTRLVEYLDEHAQPDDLLVFNALYAEIPFEAMANARPSGRLRTQGFPVSVRAWWNSQPFKGWGGPVIRHSEVPPFVEKLRSEASRIWLLEYDTHWYDPNEQLLQELQKSAQVSRVTGQPFSDSEYQLYLVEF